MLHNSVYKLLTDRKLRIGYFGGSITEGAGSSDPAKTCYRALVTAWFKNKYPDAEITEINAAIGGTGTSYGMFRCENDLLSHDPDLVFVEFAVNDNGDSYEKIFSQSCTIFRKILRHNPHADIVVLFSTSKEIIENVEQGREFESRSAQQAAARLFGASTIDHGAALHSHIRRSGRPIEDFIPDTLHPCDEGYTVIADCITKRLEEMLKVECPAALVQKPLAGTASSYDGAYMVSPESLQNLNLDGFCLKDAPAGDRFPKYLSATRGGDSFSFDFEGTHLGFTWVPGYISRDLTVEIDGGEDIRVSSWDHAERSFHRMNRALFAKDLPKGLHHAKVTVCGEADYGDCEITGINGIFLCKNE